MRTVDVELTAIRRIEAILAGLPPARRDIVLTFILGRLKPPLERGG